MRLVGYVRVSTFGREQDGQGLDIQKQAIRRWAKEHGHRVVSIHSDEEVSGTTERREGLTEAIAAVKYDGLDGLVVSSRDRLAGLPAVQEAALQQVWMTGGRVFAVDEGELLADDPEDPVRTFVHQVLGVVAQLEQELVVHRLRQGRWKSPVC